MIFEWDDDKDSSNLERHDLGLSDGISVFDDPNRLELYDDRVNYGEDRFITIGMNESARVLTVVFTEREEDTIRLISVRKATKSEQRQYAQSSGGW